MERALIAAALLITMPVIMRGAEAGEAGRQASASSAVRSVWSELDASWNARDAESFSGLFTEDANLGFVARDQYFESHAEILRHFAEEFPGYAPDLRHSTRVREIHEIVADVVAVDGTVDILRSRAGNASPAVVRSFALAAIMVKTAEGWRIRVLRAFQLSEQDSADD